MVGASGIVGTLPAVASDREKVRQAVLRYGPSVDAIARRYVNPVTGRRLSGAALLAKLLQGESRAWTDPERARNAVSPAGARRWGQFVPGTRADVIRRFGIDPWRSIDEAVHATALHLRGKVNGNVGLEGYNPGDPNYPGYILGQRVGHVGASRRAGRTMAGAPVAAVASPGGDVGGVSSIPSGAISVPTMPAPAPVGGTALKAPSFAAGPTLPKGYQLPVSGGGPLPPQPQQLPEPTQQAPLPTTSPQVAAAGGVPIYQGQTGRTAKLARIVSRAAAIDAERLPYRWGGGHGPTPGKPGEPLDCSGAVSRLLGVKPRVSGQFETFGQPGRGKNLTIYASGSHVLVEINGHFWGTSATNPGGGPGWIPRSKISASYLRGFKARHLPGL